MRWFRESVKFSEEAIEAMTSEGGKLPDTKLIKNFLISILPRQQAGLEISPS